MEAEVTSSRAPDRSREAERPITTRSSLRGDRSRWSRAARPLRSSLGTKMAPPDDGVASGFAAELLYPVRAVPTAVGAATATNVAFDVTSRPTAVQSLCRLLCQINTVAMTTTTTHSATPTATVTSRWVAKTSVVHVSCRNFSWSSSSCFDLPTSVRDTHVHKNMQFFTEAIKVLSLMA